MRGRWQNHLCVVWLGVVSECPGRTSISKGKSSTQALGLHLGTKMLPGSTSPKPRGASKRAVHRQLRSGRGAGWET
jgi:hypothetical protein